MSAHSESGDNSIALQLFVLDSGDGNSFSNQQSIRQLHREQRMVVAATAK